MKHTIRIRNRRIWTLAFRSGLAGLALSLLLIFSLFQNEGDYVGAESLKRDASAELAAIIPDAAFTEISPSEIYVGRIIRAVSISGSPGSLVNVSVELDSQGDEASISFTLNFDQTKLIYNTAVIGSGVPPGAGLNINPNQAASGRVGVLIDGTNAYSAGTRQIAVFRFNIAAGAALGATPVSFGSTPTIQSVSNVNGVLLTTTYTPGTVTIISGPPAPTVSSVTPNPVIAPATMPSTFFGTVTITGTNLQGGDITTNGPLTMTGTSTVNGAGTSISRNYQIACCVPQQGQVFNFTVTTPGGQASISDSITLAPVLSINAITSANEGNSGTTNFNFVVTKTGTTTQTVTVNYSTTNGSATAPSDYTAIPQTTLTFAPNETTKNITVLVNGDTNVEPNENFSVGLSGATNATLSNFVSDGIIFNDDADVNVSVSPTEVFEDGVPNLAYTFTRNGTNVPALTVNFSIAIGGNNAVFPGDYTQTGAATYTGLTGTVVIPAGGAASSATVTIDPTSDQTIEPDETVSLTLTPGIGYNIGIQGAATGTIRNDDVINCPPIPINYGESYNGNLNSASCVIGGNRTDIYSFAGLTGQQIAITMTSGSFFTKIELYNPQGQLIQQAGGVDTQRDSRLPNTDVFPLTASGTYTIRAIAAFGGGGAYNLALFQAPAAVCTYRLSPPRTNVPSTGGTFSFDVVTQPGCPPAPAPAPAGAIYDNLTYLGGRVIFRVMPNPPGGSARQDTIAIAGQTHVIAQFGTAAPSNDSFANPQILTGISNPPPPSPSPTPTPIIGDNTNATMEPGEPLHAGSRAKSVWYSWTPPTGAGGLYTFSTSGSSFDTVMAIYACPVSGACLITNLIPVGSNDDTTNFDRTSKVNFRANVGTQYRIAVDGKNGASGTILLTFRGYERLFRLYLQNYDGGQSNFVPDSVIASNGSVTRVGLLVSQGVYEFNLPSDNTLYRATITGPAGIVWNPNNIPLNTSLVLLDELMNGPAAGGQNNIANAENETMRFVNGFIKNITAQERPNLSVKIGYERMLGGSALDATPCTVDAANAIDGLPSASFRCLSQPGAPPDIVPNMLNKRFVAGARSFPSPIIAEVIGTRAEALLGSNEPTFDLTGRVLGGGAGTRVDMAYTPTGSTQQIVQRTTTTDSLGSYAFRNLAPNTYQVRAIRESFTFTDPPSVNLQSSVAVDIPAETLCVYTPTNLTSIPASGGVSEFRISTNDQRCDWSASTVEDWLTINSGVGPGDGNVLFTAGPKTTPGGRIGAIRIAGRADPVFVQQASAVPTFGVVSGRVATSDGRGLRNAVVTIIDSNGARQTATTSSFGLFTFSAVETGQVYTVTVSSKRFRFTPRVLQITGNLSNVDFVGLE